MNANERHLGARESRRRWSRRAGLTLVVLLGLSAVLCAWRWHKMGVALRQDVADLDRSEPGWRLRDLEAARADVPDEENGALCVLSVGELLPKRWPGGELEALTAIPPALSPAEQLDGQTFARLRAELHQVGPALGEARKLARLTTGRYPITYDRDPLAVDLSHLGEVRKAHDLLQFAAWRDAQKGDVRGAAASCRALINAARSVGDEPFVMSQSARLLYVSRACDTVARTLGQGEPEPDDLKALQELLADEDRHPGWLIAVRAERAVLHEFIGGLEGGAIDPGKYGRLPWSYRCKTYLFDEVRADHRRLFPWAGRLIAAAQLPPHLRRRAMGAFDRELHGTPLRGRGPGLLCRNGFCLAPARNSVSDLIVMEERFCGHQARLRCMIGALAAERYRRARGRWPESLDQLTPELLPAVPLDPFDGLPLRCARLDDGLVIYSVGFDGKDDGGRLAASWSSHQAGDLGFRLWDVPHRRQPPRPVPPAPKD